MKTPVPYRHFLFALTFLVGPLQAQKLHVSLDTRLVTYDTTIILKDMAALEIFVRAKDWLAEHSGEYRAQIHNELEPSLISGTFMSSYPAGLGIFVRYQNHIALRIEDGSVGVVIDNMATVHPDDSRAIPIESPRTKSNGKLRNKWLNADFNQKIEIGLNEMMTRLARHILTGESNLFPSA